MPQTSVLDALPVGKEGAQASLEPAHVISRAVELAAGIKPGRFVVSTDTTNPDRQVKLPDAAGEIVDGQLMGVSMLIPGREPGGTNGEYEDEETMPVMKKGLIWMIAEDAVAYGGQVFVRHTAAGGEELGRVRSDADTADAVAAPGARFRSATSGADELVLVELNMPAS